MSTALKLSDPTVRAIVSAAFPNYGGKHVTYHAADTFRPYGTMWDEGNKRTYRIVRLADLGTCCVPEEVFWVANPAHRADHTIPNGCVVVVWCQGRWEHIEIIGPTAVVTPLLPAPVELTREEQIVLSATRNCKSSYAGIKNYRFHEAQQYTGIDLACWEAAKQSLISRGLLNRAGAITVDGRNAIGRTELYELRQPAALAD